jgi:hypothetical protein
VIVHRDDVVTGLAVYAVTALPVVLGVFIGTTPGLIEQYGPVEDFLHGLCHYDGGHFESIVNDGYRYDPDRGSTVAFFPGYPLAVDGVRRLTGWPTRLAMVATSNLALCAAFVLLAAYLRVRLPGGSPALRMTILTLVGVWPLGFYFRIGYSEGLFLLGLALLLLGFALRWPLVVLAVVAGALSGTRAVGAAAGAAVIVYVLADRFRGPPGRRVALAALLAPLCLWGLLAFMAYQQARFGTPFAFVRVQQHWKYYEPRPGDIQSKAARLALAEPIWNAYVPGSSRHWSNYEQDGKPFLALGFWNPILFLAAAVAVVVGWWRGRLTDLEVVLGAGLLLIPYLGRADELSMGSHGRFAAVVVPAFVVFGLALHRLPPAARWAVLAGLAAVLGLCSARFAALWPLC